MTNLEAAALRIVQAMFGGEALCFSMDDAKAQQKANTQQWQVAMVYARAALNGEADQ